MLSVQSPGCAGMERLGGRGRSAVGGGGARSRGDRNELSHLTATFMARQRVTNQSEPINLPPHIQLPDGEGGPDRHISLRVEYQQAELTRTSVLPPPNKSVMDVPEWAGPVRRPIPPSPHKKDNLLQKAVNKLRAKMVGGGRGGEASVTEEEIRPGPPCVMVPLRPPPAPPS